MMAKPKGNPEENHLDCRYEEQNSLESDRSGVNLSGQELIICGWKTYIFRQNRTNINLSK
jgi:hypothetical protein